MKKGMTFVYIHGGVPYINLTNRCCNRCSFCLRENGDGIEGNVLWLEREPSAGEAIAALRETLAKIRARSGGNAPSECVFCGYGEPTYRLDALIEVAAFAHSQGLKTRLNTNGLGDLINGFDIVPRLTGAVDAVSVSLNEPDAERYNAACRPSFGLKAFDALLGFTKSCARAEIETALTVVDVIGEPAIAECRKLAESAGVRLRVRKWIGDNKSYR